MNKRLLPATVNVIAIDNLRTAGDLGLMHEGKTKYSESLRRGVNVNVP
ncbi:MAG: hypothetical protein AAF098_12660 [Pseudomonadota bacterium]